MADETPDISDRDGLAALIEGLSDEEIETAVKVLGADEVIAQVADAIPAQFNADNASGQSAVFQWDVTVDGEIKSFHVSVADGTCTSAIGPAESPRVTLGFTLANFMKFIAGKLDGMQAFMGGQMKLTGDMMFAQQMQTWFDMA
jgi:putative sterol carrier protein